LVWKYPSLTRLGNLTGHSSGVLYMAVSSNGEFWNMCSKASSQEVSAQFMHWGNIFFNGLHFLKWHFYLQKFIENIYGDFQVSVLGE
ncbi:hypothetical protein B7P43_G01660, partial [Cryptotermes secundus]